MLATGEKNETLARRRASSASPTACAQLDDELPSHIVVPAVHKLRTDVAQVFADHLGADPDDDDVHHLAEAQREATRPLILKAGAGLTGCTTSCPARNAAATGAQR